MAGPPSVSPGHVWEARTPTTLPAGKRDGKAPAARRAGLTGEKIRGGLRDDQPGGGSRRRRRRGPMVQTVETAVGPARSPRTPRVLVVSGGVGAGHDGAAHELAD